ncbi:MAG: PaaI family thioesterase [Candidatus Cloacimonetes bacterium]|nr:PaaI family thioesterase [Candidatus Cloacimonadota bacterium]
MSDSYPHCFACGEDSPIGLHLVFRYEDGDAICDCVIAPEFQGYNGIVHGGIIATLLDEAMAKAVLHAGFTAMTGRLEVSYRKPIMVETPLTLRGRIDSSRGRIHRCSAEVIDAQGEVCAAGTSTYVRARQGLCPL